MLLTVITAGFAMFTGILAKFSSASQSHICWQQRGGNLAEITHFLTM